MPQPRKGKYGSLRQCRTERVITILPSLSQLSAFDVKQEAEHIIIALGKPCAPSLEYWEGDL